MHTPAWRSEFLSMAESFELPDDSSDTEEHSTTSMKPKRRQGDVKKNTQVSSSSKKLKEKDTDRKPGWFADLDFDELTSALE